MVGWVTWPGWVLGGGGSDGPGWVGGGTVGWGWPRFCGWVVGGTVAGGAVVVGFSTWPPRAAGGTTDWMGRSRLAWSMKSCQIWAGSDPPDTAESPRTLSSLWLL